MKTFLRILAFAKPHWDKVIIAFSSSIFYSIFNAMSLWIVSSLIGTIMGSEDNNIESINPDSFHNKLDNFFDQIINSSNELEQLKFVCIFLFLSFLFKNIFYYIHWISVSIIELKIIRDVRNKLYTHTQSFPLSFFDKNKTGEIFSIMMNDVASIRVAFNKSLHVFLHEIVSIIILLSLLFSISPKLTLLVLLTIPLAGFIILKIGYSIRRKAKRASFKIADLSSIISEKLSGIKIVKAFNMTKKEISNFIKINSQFFQLQYRQNKLVGLTTPINDIIGVTLASLLLWFGGKQVLLLESITSEEFLRFIIFLFALLQPTRKLGGSYAALQNGLAGANRVFSILDININKKIEKDVVFKKDFNDAIEFKNVYFKYNPDESEILKNINIKINKGEKIALVGSSGAGKTTFANLLLDFYSTSSGQILIDNIDYKKINTASIRGLIGIVTQEPILFNDSIENNIAYGQDDINKDLIIRAAKNANIDSYIESIEEKYSTKIGERGVRLSGGQKQRLSIARAILKNTPILVLDEATSSLDSESELKVQNAIDNLVKNRTVIIIAHRLSTIKTANKIIVFEKGKIIEIGNHEQLMNNNGKYKKLYELQYQNK